MASLTPPTYPSSTQKRNFNLFILAPSYYNCRMKKPRSLHPASSRMEQRAIACRKLPAEQQAAHYYCNGAQKADFCAAVADGQTAPLNLALDLLAAEHWLQPRDGARYARSIRAALRTACAAQRLSTEQQKLHFAIEWRYLERLTLRARHSTPGQLQQRALRRLPGQQALMQQLFNCTEQPPLTPTDWPEVPPPVTLLKKATNHGLLPPSLAEQLATCNYEALMVLYHYPESLLPPGYSTNIPDLPADTLCYMLSEWDHNNICWRIAPWEELRRLLGLAIAADGSFCHIADEWGNNWRKLRCISGQ